MLNLIVSDQATDKTSLLIAHGLFGSARNWGVIAQRLSDTRQVVTVDMRNHGQSEWFQSHSYDDLAGDLAEVITHRSERMDVLGHSMGGKAAMILALGYPRLVRRMVVADIAPTAYNHTQIHLVEAMRKVDLNAVGRRADAAAQLSQIDDPTLISFLLQSIDIKEKKWRLNLDILASEMGKILGFPPITGRFEGDVLFLSGGDSDYVTRAHRTGIKALFPKAQFARIPDAGHWLHAQRPRAFEAAVRVFLDR